MPDGVCGGNRTGYTAGSVLAGWLDRVLYRHPFEGASARRYAMLERPAFGDLHERLLDGLAGALAEAKVLLDVGAGPGTLSSQAARRHPHLTVVALDPSRHYAVSRPGEKVVCARGEAIPLADGSVDVATATSSIRHVRDRLATLRELRRVVRPGGTTWIVELDPSASADRISAHGHRLGSAILRRAFGPLVVKTAPRASAIQKLAERAGWTTTELRDDPVQPVYILELR